MRWASRVAPEQPVVAASNFSSHGISNHEEPHFQVGSMTLGNLAGLGFLLDSSSSLSTTCFMASSIRAVISSSNSSACSSSPSLSLLLDTS